jgi:hypothetical protein
VAAGPLQVHHVEEEYHERLPRTVPRLGSRTVRSPSGSASEGRGVWRLEAGRNASNGPARPATPHDRLLKLQSDLGVSLDLVGGSDSCSAAVEQGNAQDAGPGGFAIVHTRGSHCKPRKESRTVRRRSRDAVRPSCSACGSIVSLNRHPLRVGTQADRPTSRVRPVSLLNAYKNSSGADCYETPGWFRGASVPDVELKLP